MLTLKNLSLTASDAQGRTDIVKNVSLDVEDGKFLVITGPNGGGKTTLAKLIMGLAVPTGGQILLDGEDITPLSITDRAYLLFEGKILYQGTSEELAAMIAERAMSGAGDMAFVIGSSHGLDDSVKRAAQARISLGRITLPHQLARLVLTEQLYRACTINAGMKYHK